MSEKAPAKKVLKKKTEAAEKPAKAPKAETAKKAKPKAEAAERSPRSVPDGHFGLTALAEEFGKTPAAIRRVLRNQENLSKPEGQFGWYWKEGSKEGNQVRKLMQEWTAE